MQTSSLEQLVGQDLGAYRVERLLGRGHVNAVYLAYRSRQNSPFALVMFTVPEKFSSAARQYFLLRFRQEATKLTALRQPHILPVYDYGEYAGSPYLVTPYMTNGSLADLLKRRGRLHHTDVLDILRQVGAGLAYAHEKSIFHGALKPANIVLNDQQQMLVAGFGLTQILQMHGIEQDQKPYGHLFTIAGTFLTAPEYLAPEVVQGQSGDARTDIYSLGVILFELLSGKPPFTGTKPLKVAMMHVQQPILSLHTHSPDIPLALAAVVNQALDRDPARRFQRVDELVEAFAQVSSALPEKGANNTVRARSSEELQETPALGYGFGYWQPPQELSFAPRSGPAQSNTRQAERSSIPQQRFRPSKGYQAQGNERFSRRKVIASLAAGGVAIAGTIIAINLAGKAPNQQAQNNAANLAKNAAMNFTNPANGKASVLVHLANGNFVAYDQTCTHKNVYVAYDPAQQLLVCPAHGATFDPAQDGAVQQGPATQPLPKVAFHINADGTITA